jgi:hypothetical protein
MTPSGDLHAPTTIGRERDRPRKPGKRGERDEEERDLRDVRVAENAGDDGERDDGREHDQAAPIKAPRHRPFSVGRCFHEARRGYPEPTAEKRRARAPARTDGGR